MVMLVSNPWNNIPHPKEGGRASFDPLTRVTSLGGLPSLHVKRALHCMEKYFRSTM